MNRVLEGDFDGNVLRSLALLVDVFINIFVTAYK